MDHLLAKSQKQGFAPKTLTDHTRDVLDAVEALFGQADKPTRLAESWLCFFGLAVADFGRFLRNLCVAGRFLRNLCVAAAAHDWGKANDGFQNAVTEGGEQVVRHEHLSGLMLADLVADKAI